MALLGSSLVSSSPDRPVEQLVCGVQWCQDECYEEAPKFVDTQPNQCRIGAFMSSLGGGEYRQECVGEHDEDGRAVPGGPGAYLQLIEPGESFAGLEGFFDGPASPGYPHQRGQGRGSGTIAAVVRQFAGVIVAADQ